MPTTKKAKVKLYINNLPVNNVKAFWEQKDLDYGSLKNRLFQAKKREEVEFNYKGFKIRRVLK